jgi:hypothetical protein
VSQPPIWQLSTNPGSPLYLNAAPSLSAPYLAHGGRSLNGDAPANQRAVVRYADSPEETRAVILRSVRIGTSIGHVVALVDGNDSVADWSSVSVHGSRDRARAAGNRLVGLWGGEAEPPINHTSNGRRV